MKIAKALWCAQFSIAIITQEPLKAQTLARISGQVLDASKGAIPEAAIAAENLATGYRREVLTDVRGTYSIPELPIGDYRVVAEKTGYQPQVCPTVHLGVGLSVQVDFEVVSIKVVETVNVTAE